MYRNTAQAAEAEAALDDRDAYIIARLSAGTCEYCGSRDGMQDTSRETVALALEWEPDRTYWRWPANPHHLSRPCRQCNPGGVVPLEYERLNAEQVQAWLAEQAKVEKE